MKYPTINLQKTGDNIKRLMKKNSLNVSKLQEIFGFEYPQAIYKWLRGDSLPSLDNLVVLADIFHVTIDQMLIIE